MKQRKDSTLLDRRVAVAALLQERGELLLVTGLGSSTFDAFASGDHDGTMYLWGAMGGAAMVGLGLARAQAHRPVLVLTGDGEQLMGLGALATVSVSSPPNLTLVVLDNGQFAETGLQASHTGLGTDLCRIAAGAGFPSAVELHELQDIAEYRKQIHRIDGGPRFASLRIAPGNSPRKLPARDGVFLKNRMRAHLGHRVR